MKMPTNCQFSGPIRHHLFSWPVDLFTKNSLLIFLKQHLACSSKIVIANLNLHALHCAEGSFGMASLLNRPSTFVHIDGMPIVWLLKAHGVKATAANRLTYLDWAEEALEICAEERWKVGYLGSTLETCQKGISYYRDKFPTLQIQGWDGYFDMQDISTTSKLSETLQSITSYAPNLLIVGMGMPRQEEFLALHSHRLHYGVAVCSGAFFEYVTGHQSLPPRTMGKLGLEWLYRLACDPGRYAGRYLVEPWVLAYNILKSGKVKRVRRRR
jgi:N-acetylglucosaminyldiphosphoundecaprenol N-acetyl-beta-D-mannosaminyltransferase